MSTTPDAPRHVAAPQAVFYARCPGAPTTSNLAFQLGYLDEELARETAYGIQFECVHLVDPALPHWLRHSSPVLAARDRSLGLDTHVVAFSWLQGAYQLFVADAAAVHSLADLKGKRVAAVRNARLPVDFWRAQQFKIYDTVLRAAGLSLADVVITDVPVPADPIGAAAGDARPDGDAGDRSLIEALHRGEVDVITASVPEAAVRRFGLRKIYDSRQHPDPLMRVTLGTLRCLVASGALLRDHREVVVAVLARLLEAAEWGMAHPAETVRLLARDLNTSEEAQTGFAAQLAGAFKVAAADVKAQVEFNPDRVTSWRQIGYAKHQLTKEQFRDNTVDAAVIGAAESGNALYAIQINPAGDGPVATVRVRFRTPGMQDVQEHSWLVPYTGTAVSLDRAAPAMRLAATAGAFAEWLSESPYAAEVMPADLINLLQGVPQVYATDPRPQKLIDMIRQSGSAVIQAPGNTGSGGARGEF